MRRVVLMRKGLTEEDEFKVANEWLDVCEMRMQLVGLNDHQNETAPLEDLLVIPRYSSLPYYEELDADVHLLGGRLINSYRQHRYVADMKNWYEDFKDVTPKTWFQPSDVPRGDPGSFVLKGATNSRKHLWDTHMFAKDRADIGRVMSNLLNDPLISEQGIYVRRYEKFEKLADNVHGLPVTDEWRFFILNGKIIARGFYWSAHPEAWEEHYGPRHWLHFKAMSKIDASQFVESLLSRLEKKIPFVVLDVARRKDNKWRLVELNCGTMSGLSECDARDLYYGLANEPIHAEEEVE